jgi:hypothetical protein
MNFINSLHCELLKIKGSALLWVSIAGSIVLSMVFTLRFIYLRFHIDLWAEGNAWERLYLQNARPFAGFLLPIGVILICSLITQIEYRNNNWKQLHTTPQTYVTIFLAKFTTLLVVTFIVFFFFNVGVLVNGIAPNLIVSGSFPRDAIPFHFLLEQTFKSFISILPIIGLQYLLSLQYKNFIVAIGAGLVLYVGTMPMSRVDFSFLSPYSYALHYFDQNFNEHHYLRAIIYFVLVFTISFFLYIKKKEKG